MAISSKLRIAAPAAFALAVSFAGSASAGMVTPTPLGAVAPASGVESVHYRWHRHWAHGCHHHHHWVYSYYPSYTYYDPGYYNPGATVVGAASTVASAPFWPLWWLW